MRINRPFYGIFLNYPNSGHQIYNNTVLGPVRIEAPTEGNVVRDNIFGSVTIPDEGVVFDNNILLTEHDPASVFKDYDEQDYCLAPDSPAAPDIGALDCP